MEAVLESAVRREVDMVLIQEPGGEKEKDGTRSHPSFTFIRGDENGPAKCWIAINRVSRCRVKELKELTWGCQNYTQVVEVVPPGGEGIVIANVYDRHQGSETNRPAQRVAWGEIAKYRRVIIAGDMNAHSRMWIPRATYNKNHIFWEKLIEKKDLFV
jgi:endonuclease/exonuclease/phosphatase (EEP) superfamily protein YafD